MFFRVMHVSGGDCNLHAKKLSVQLCLRVPQSVFMQRRATSSRVDVRSGEDGAGSGIPTEILAHGMIAINSAGSITQTAVRKISPRSSPRSLLSSRVMISSPNKSRIAKYL